MRKRIMAINNAFFVSGAELSLKELAGKCDGDCDFIFVLSENSSVQADRSGSESYYIPMKWLYKTRNPVLFFRFIWSIVVSCFFLVKIINKVRPDCIYANTTKACVYAVAAKFYTRKKMIWHVRDQLNHTLLHKVLARNSDIIISVSKYIDDQVPACEYKKRLIYGGIDAGEWIVNPEQSGSLKKELGLGQDTILIAQIGQLTRWKNHFDLIRAADMILQCEPEIHFLIVGDDLSGREKKYKAELKKLVAELKLEPHLSFPGNRHDIKELLNQIDIIIHPAINEPFGRVILEAMALEKPVVAYDCGGLREIIINNETGYLVEPYDYHALANKTLALIRDRELRGRFGKAGRKRVIEKFNMERYVREMEEVFG